MVVTKIIHLDVPQTRCSLHQNLVDEVVPAVHRISPVCLTRLGGRRTFFLVVESLETRMKTKRKTNERGTEDDAAPTDELTGRL